MARRYTYATCLSWGGDTPTAEVEVEVSFSVAWGSPGSGRPYYGPPENYDEGSPSEVEDIRLEKVEGKPRPWGMYSGYVANEDDQFESEVVEMLEGHHAEMIAEASEVEAMRADEAAEYRREAAREAF
jgi:hypothetical protein